MAENRQARGKLRSVQPMGVSVHIARSAAACLPSVHCDNECGCVVFLGLAVWRGRAALLCLPVLCGFAFVRFGGWPRVPPLYFVGDLGFASSFAVCVLPAGLWIEKLCITSVVMFSRKLHAVWLLP